MKTELYRTGTIKRDRRTKERIAQLDKQIAEVVEADNPQSIRHVFYRMTDPRLPEPVEKSDRGYRHVQERLKILRRNGIVPYGWISDSSRMGYHTATYRNAAHFLRQVKGLYRADLWKDSPYHVEVWVESRSIAGVLIDLCEELAVSLYPCGGFASITSAYEAADQINDNYHEISYVVLYVGDYDPAGVLIDKALEAELRQHLNSGIDLDFVRVGITPEQIREYDLPTKPRKATDKRSLEITRTVEAEAMPAETLREILRAAIELYLNDDALEVAKAAEESERLLLDGIVKMAERPNGGRVS
jgi:hypothetical protein